MNSTLHPQPSTESTDLCPGSEMAVSPQGLLALLKFCGARLSPSVHMHPAFMCAQLLYKEEEMPNPV